MIISTVLSDKPIIEGNSVTLPICRVGTKAYDEKGNEYTITKEAIESSADSYTGGIITINHKYKEKGKIAKSWLDGEFIMATVEGLSKDCVDAVNSPAYRGVSQESKPVETDDKNNILKLNGTGVTFVFYPENPACPLNKGCGVPIASTMVTADGNYERHSFDVAVENNAGTLVKVSEISVYLNGDEIGDKDILKKRILQEAMFIGAGQYKIFNVDTSLETGDVIPADKEVVHDVNISVSMLKSFNFPLNTPNQKLQSNEPGGVNIADDDVTKLESTISELKTENKELKSTVDQLRQELKTKEEEIPGKIESAIKVALEADRTKAQEQAEYNAAVEELRSCVSEELAEEYLKTEPTAAMIRSTIAIKKGEAGKQIGASGGNGGGDNKIMSTYKAGNDIYSKLGVEADDLEKYGGVTE
jgi:polyhydroxyalkanoate synthesis regulator phasin